MIDIVIVNWNAGRQLKDCIDSILTVENNQVSRIIVVDNGSTDGSIEAIKSLPKIDIYEASENLGFGAACNLGARKCDASYILFLNPDTFLEENSLSIPLEFMDDKLNKNVGICGIQLYGNKGGISRTCAYNPTTLRFLAKLSGLTVLPFFHSSGILMMDWDHSSTREVSHVMGAFYMIRKETFHTCNGFDERFFVYLEDLDLSIRAKKQGWKIWYLTSAKAFHEGGGTSKQVKAMRLFYSLRSRLLYGFKHFPRWQAWLLFLATNILEPITRSLFCLLKLDWQSFRNTWSAYLMLWKNLPKIINGEGRFHP